MVGASVPPCLASRWHGLRLTAQVREVSGNKVRFENAPSEPDVSSSWRYRIGPCAIPSPKWHLAMNPHGRPDGIPPGSSSSLTTLPAGREYS